MSMALPILSVSSHYPRRRAVEFYTIKSEFESGVVRTREGWTRERSRFGLSWRSIRNTDAATLWAFYQGRKGAALLFDVQDYRDYQVTDEAVGTGNGSQTAFQLDKKFIEEGSETVKVGGVTKTRGVDYTINNDTGVVTFGAAPGEGVAVTASYEFYYRCSFEQDSLTEEEFMHQFYNEGLSLVERFV